MHCTDSVFIWTLSCFSNVSSCLHLIWMEYRHVVWCLTCLVVCWHLPGEHASSKSAAAGILCLQTNRSRWNSSRLRLQVAVQKPRLLFSCWQCLYIWQVSVGVFLWFSNVSARFYFTASSVTLLCTRPGRGNTAVCDCLQAGIAIGKHHHNQSPGRLSLLPSTGR